MKILKTNLFLIFLALGSGCSFKTAEQNSGEFDTNDQLFSESSVIEVVPSVVENIVVKTPEPDFNAVIQTDEVVVKAEEPGIYVVRRGDTWMIISQKLLGSPLKWRKIQKMNPDFKKSSDLYVGAKVVYTSSTTPIIQPDGSPYLIKKMDTLPKISKKVYGTKNQWDVIYFNNREIIRSPDLIYSGFVISYPETDAIASLKNQMAEMNFKVKSPRKPASLK